MKTVSTDIQKFLVAEEMLNWALKAYRSGSGYFAALHLAGAAEEVFAVYLRSPGNNLTPASDSFTELVLHVSEPKNKKEAKQIEESTIARMNAARNAVKHKRGHGDDVVTFDAEDEAVAAIRRAINNYVQLREIHPLNALEESILEFAATAREKEVSKQHLM